MRSGLSCLRTPFPASRGGAYVTVPSMENPSAAPRERVHAPVAFLTPLLPQCQRLSRAVANSSDFSRTSDRASRSSASARALRPASPSSPSSVGPVLVPRVSSPRAEENEVVTGPRMTPRHHFEVYSSAGEEEEEEEEEEKVRGGGGAVPAIRARPPPAPRDLSGKPAG
ncbi:unnamed protein product [Rangifer tarandus platyrhynchus]|uniref:Uncharacterized protein n=2 Tax=Rangifer tarandus platyrhynchus TaxID=3082113 RepID=A0ACB0F3V8_RANTA|nr:unnamed protein product [Rangifer tarandus platyrhynchus]CAI9707382.1 unnamed protein product [Rangifer tarandus platyrhynchus]